MKNVTDFRKTVESGVDPHLKILHILRCQTSLQKKRRQILKK